MKQQQINLLDIHTIFINEDNPRTIKDKNFKKLVKSIKDFPEMMNIRPIVVNEEMIVLGGNMRLKAMIAAGVKKVPVLIAKGLSEQKQKEFIIKDNLAFGDWNFDQLANEWNEEDLQNWCLEIPDFTNIDTPLAEEVIPSDKAKQLVQSFQHLLMNYIQKEKVDKVAKHCATIAADEIQNKQLKQAVKNEIRKL